MTGLVWFVQVVHRSLVATNRLRTASWTAHSAIVLVMVARLIP
jgi:hypothetical protein